MIQKAERGFTLIELMMATAIGIFVLGAIASLLFAGIGAVKSVGQFHWIHQEARKAMQWIDRDVKESYSILNLQTLDGTVYQTDKDTLVLQRSGGAGGDYDFVVYNLVSDGTDYLGSNIYRIDRIFFDNYTIAGAVKANSSKSTRTIAKNVVAPTGSDYLFSAAGTKVSIDLTVSRADRRAREQIVTLDGASLGTPSNNNESMATKLRLLSEIKMRN